MRQAWAIAAMCLAQMAQAQQVTTGSASSLQGLPVKAPLTCGDAHVITWVEANKRFECLAPSGGGSSSFAAITAGTNTAALLVGTGGSLSVSGSGTINATSLGGVAAASYTRTIASGTAVLGTSEIASEACATAVTATATGTATTDAISFTPNVDITAVTGYAPVTEGGLSIYPYPTANNVNFKACNATAFPITPGAVTLNWRVVR
jgi:hypothetical protein